MTGETEHQQPTPGASAVAAEHASRPRSNTLPWQDGVIKTRNVAQLTDGIESDDPLIKKTTHSANTFSPTEKRVLVILLGSIIGLLIALLLILFLPGLIPALAALFKLIGLPAFLGRIIIDLLGVFVGVLFAALLERALGERRDENARFMQRLIIFTTMLTGVTLSFLIAAMYPVVFEFFVGLMGTGIGVYALIGLAGVMALSLVVGAVALIEWLVRRAMQPSEADRLRATQEIDQMLADREIEGEKQVEEANKNLPTGWRAYRDMQGELAYENTLTNKCQWNRPTEPAEEPKSEAASTSEAVAPPSTTTQPLERSIVASCDASTSSRPDTTGSTDLPEREIAQPEGEAVASSSPAVLPQVDLDSLSTGASHQPLSAVDLSRDEAKEREQVVAGQTAGEEFKSPIITSGRRPSQAQVLPVEGASPKGEADKDSGTPSPSDNSTV